MVFLVVFIDLLGFGIVLPLLPRYAEQYLTPLNVSGGLAGLTLGVLYSSFSLMQFLFSPMWGRISDRVGRRPVLLVGLVGSVVFYTLFGYASQLPPETSAVFALWLLLAARTGAGIAGATVGTAQAVIADTTTPETRSRGMALIGMAFGFGFTFGPLIAYAAVVWFPDHHGGPGFLAAGLSAVALFLGLALLPETRRPDGVPAGKRWFDIRASLETLRTPTVGLLVLTFFLTILGFAMFEATLSLLTQEAFAYKDDANFLVFAFVGFVLMFAQGGLYRPLAKRLSETTFMAAGVILMLVGLGLLAVVAALAGRTGVADAGGGTKALFYASLATGVIGFAFLNPSVQALISRRSDPARQGEVLGVNQSFAALARILGPVLGLWLFKLTANHVLPYAVGAALLVVVLGLTRQVKTA
jgi:DHA1 family tetracycline resistance protein-like MFS transporter